MVSNFITTFTLKNKIKRILQNEDGFFGADADTQSK